MRSITSNLLKYLEIPLKNTLSSIAFYIAIPAIITACVSELSNAPTLDERQEIPSTYHFWKKHRLLGKGDQAEVFLVEDEQKNFFALKCFYKKEEQASRIPLEVLPLLFKNDGTPISAIAEWEVSQQLHHPNLLQYYAFTPGIESTLLMEWIEGKTVRDISSKSFDLSTTLTLLIEGADALQYAFDKGWINQDLHSVNVMVDNNQHLKFIDLASFERMEDNTEEAEALEEVQDNLGCFFNSILVKGNLSTEKKEQITQILQAPFISSYWEEHKQNLLSPEAGHLFATILREIMDHLDKMKQFLANDIII